jgi:hypothetical protein
MGCISFWTLYITLGQFQSVNENMQKDFVIFTVHF